MTGATRAADSVKFVPFLSRGSLAYDNNSIHRSEEFDQGIARVPKSAGAQSGETNRPATTAVGTLAALGAQMRKDPLTSVWALTTRTSGTAPGMRYHAE